MTPAHADQRERIIPATLGYFTIPVAGLERGKAFYGAVFGRQFEAGDRYAHVPNTTPPGGLHVDDSAHPKFWFRVPDIHAAVARVWERGGTATESEASDSGLSADYRDDQGTYFSLWQPAPGV